jgi:hypothetical protein
VSRRFGSLRFSMAVSCWWRGWRSCRLGRLFCAELDWRGILGEKATLLSWSFLWMRRLHCAVVVLVLLVGGGECLSLIASRDASDAPTRLHGIDMIASCTPAAAVRVAPQPYEVNCRKANCLSCTPRASSVIVRVEVCHGLVFCTINFFSRKPQ